MTKSFFIRKVTLAIIITGLFAGVIALYLLVPGSNSVDASNYKFYSKDGLSFRYPSHWNFEYDEAPDLFADRGISFKTSEGSYVDLYIFKKGEASIESVVDYFKRSINPKMISDYRQIRLQLGNFNGVALSWKNTFLASYPVEVSILEIRSADEKIFVVFNFDKKGHTKESSHRVPFLESIKVL